MGRKTGTGPSAPAKANSTSVHPAMTAAGAGSRVATASRSFPRGSSTVSSSFTWRMAPPPVPPGSRVSGTTSWNPGSRSWKIRASGRPWWRGGPREFPRGSRGHLPPHDPDHVQDLDSTASWTSARKPWAVLQGMAMSSAPHSSNIRADSCSMGTGEGPCRRGPRADPESAAGCPPASGGAPAHAPPESSPSPSA